MLGSRDDQVPALVFQNKNHCPLIGWGERGGRWGGVIVAEWLVRPLAVLEVRDSRCKRYFSDLILTSPNYVPTSSEKCGH